MRAGAVVGIGGARTVSIWPAAASARRSGVIRGRPNPSSTMSRSCGAATEHAVRAQRSAEW